MVAELSEVRAALRGVSRRPLSATYFRAGTVASKSVNRRMRVQSLMIARLADGERLVPMAVARSCQLLAGPQHCYDAERLQGSVGSLRLRL